MSTPEDRFMFLWKFAGGEHELPEREYRFHDTRRWRFDFAWPDAKVAVELEGGMWINGRHNRATGFISDCHKYNAASLLGWIVLRFTTGMLKDEADKCINQVRAALAMADDKESY